MVVQGVGAATTLIVLMQLAIAGAMPLPAFAATATAVVLGFILNLLNYQELLRPSLWLVWEEAVTIGGVTVLPQVYMKKVVFASSVSSQHHEALSNSLAVLVGVDDGEHLALANSFFPHMSVKMLLLYNVMFSNYLMT